MLDTDRYLVLCEGIMDIENFLKDNPDARLSYSDRRLAYAHGNWIMYEMVYADPDYPASRDSEFEAKQYNSNELDMALHELYWGIRRLYGE